MTKRFTFVCALAPFAFAACSAGAMTGPPVQTVNPTSPSYAALQFAVGTANIYGNAAPGLNIVSTYRQANGSSALGADTPSISGPFTFAATAVASYAEATNNSGFPDPYTTVLEGGPSLSERGGSTIMGTPQTVTPGTPSCDAAAPPPGQNLVPCVGGLAPNTTTFGQSGGVFIMGLAPYNVVAATQQSYSYQPYAQPFYGAQDATTTFQFIPWGGPPAFDPDGTKMGERDGAGSINGFDSFGDAYFLGVPEGITVFDGLNVATGTYKLSVAVSTVGSGGKVSTQTVTQTAQLSALAMLPAVNAPVVVPDANGDGGATFTTALPAGVTEAYVQVVDYGPGGGPNDGAAPAPSNCQGARGTRFAPVYYTMHITNAASTTYTLPPAIGPNLATSGGASNLKPSPTICTAAQNTAANGGTATPADDIVVQMFGFDYPIYAATPQNVNQTIPETPKITNGTTGQADITISRAEEEDAGGTTQTPLILHSRVRAFASNRILR
jgi:hypothetical protein